MLTATAAEIVVTDQPNSARSGSMSTPGTARKAAAPTRARKVTPATHQAGWTRCVRGAAVLVTAGSMAGGGTAPPVGPRAAWGRDPALKPAPGRPWPTHPAPPPRGPG